MAEGCEPVGEVALRSGLAKLATGVEGLDEVLHGGLPAARPTLLLGGPGCGKTILALSILRRGCELGQPGVFVTLEQSRERVVEDAASVGIDVAGLEASGRLLVLALDLSGEEFCEAGSYTLDGFMSVLDRAVTKVDAVRVVVDQIDAVFDHLENARQLRIEFQRLAKRMSERGVALVMTGSPPGGEHRMEEFLSDCVLHLDHRIDSQVSTRRLRVMKYRGTAHGTDEYPFVITSKSVRVFPITSSALSYEVSDEKLSTGVADLDAMLGGGIYRGSAVLLAGPAGTGKTTLACKLAETATQAGQRAVYFSFEESPRQIQRNAGTVGIQLRHAEEAGLFEIRASRPSVQGLEQHLAMLLDTVASVRADLVVVDPITNFVSVGDNVQVKAMLTRMIDGFREQGVTVLMTSLVFAGDERYGGDVVISSLMDSIVLLEHRVTSSMRRARLLSVLKSRGMANSQEIRELGFSERGIGLTPLFGKDGGTGDGRP